MNVGISINGCILDNVGFFREHGERFFDGQLNEAEFLSGTFGYKASESMLGAFKSFESPLYFKNARIFQGAKEWISRIKQAGNNIFIITSGKYSGYSNFDEYRLGAVEWLNEEGIEYDGILFCRGLKGEICKSIGINLMFESTPEQIDDIVKKNPEVFLYVKRAMYNTEVLKSLYCNARLRDFKYWTDLPRSVVL